jgi:hypothetical protein
MPDHARMDASHPSTSPGDTVEGMARRFFRLLLPSGFVLAVALLVRRSVHLRSEVFRVIPSRDPWTPITEAERPEAPQPSEAEAPPPSDAEAPQPSEAESAQPSDAEAPEAAAAADAAETSQPATAWRAPVDGACPPTHLIKAKEASGIYHLPGMVNYNRTRPDRCYAEASAAEADGFTKAKR